MRHPVERILKRSLFGYRRSQVDLLFDAQSRQLAQMAESLERVWQERSALADELASTRARLEAELEQERARREEADLRGRIAAARLLAEAEEQAMRLRHEASLRVGDASSRLEDLLRVREQLLGELRGTLEAYGRVLEQAEQGTLAAAAPPRRAETARPAPAIATAELRPPLPLRSADALAAGLFPRRVEIDAGPFADFAELSTFERSLARLPKVQDVYIRSFGDERAQIELTLSEETPLDHDLRGHLPGMIVAATDDHRVSVEVVTDAATG